MSDRDNSDGLNPPLAGGHLGGNAELGQHQNLPRWYPHLGKRPAYHGNEEAFAWCIDGIGRAIQFVGAGAFVGVSLIHIASVNAGCVVEIPEGESRVPVCDERIYGIKPSSVLTTYNMVIGVGSTLLLPLLGAIIDYTPHRLLAGRVTSVLFVLLMIPQLLISYDTFGLTAILQILISFMGWAQTAITYAYLPELTADESKMNDYTKSYTMFFFSAMVIYLAVVIGGINLIGKSGDDIATARFGISLALLVNIVCLPIAWGPLFKDRPAMHELPPGQSIFTAGFVQLYRTSVKIRRNYRALMWFFIAIAFSDAGLQGTGTISITFWTDQLQFTAQESGIGVLLLLFGSVPGAVVANRVTRRYDPCTSSRAALIVLTITTIVYSIVIKDPSQKLLSYLITMGWGFGVGWKWTSDRVVTSFIIPEGQDAELMGVFLFAGQVLTWIPSFIYIVLNEAGVSPRYGVASLVFWFLLSYISYVLMGSYDNARIESGRGLVTAGEIDSTTSKEGTHKKRVELRQHESATDNMNPLSDPSSL